MDKAALHRKGGQSTGAPTQTEWNESNGQYVRDLVAEVQI